MHKIMLNFYESIAKKIERYTFLLFAISIIIYITGLVYTDKLNFNSSLATLVAMCWPFGLSLISWNYGQETLIKEYGEIVRIGKMRKESSSMILYANLFYSTWFFFILLLTIYLIYHLVTCK